MKRFINLVVCIVLLTLADSAPACAAQNTTAFQSVQADFVQEKHLQILKRPLISQGTFTFQMPASLRWEYLEPVHSILLMQDDKTEKFIERDGKLERDTGMSAGMMQYVLSDIGNWLDGRFAENPIFGSEKIDEKTVVLTPKDEGMRSVISKIELHLGDQAGVMESVTITEDAGSFTVLEFNNIVLNDDIPKKIFRVQ